MHAFPKVRLRRLRYHPQLREMIRDVRLSVKQMVYPLFIRQGIKIKHPVSSMPGIYQFSLDQVLREIESCVNLGISSILIFGIPDKKDFMGSQSYSSRGVVQKSLRAIKKEFPNLFVISDVCLCSYTSHGHCGLIHTSKGRRNQIDNDSTLRLLKRIACSHAEAGADMVAPSGMMDGMIRAIRTGLDQANFAHLPIMSYAAKYASSFYGPFREAAESPPKFGDRKTYQMDYGRTEEALREVSLDLDEGADMVMVKPALAYLDIIAKIREKYPVPIAAYHVSGEYSMVSSASQKGWLNEKDTIIEILHASIRAGANLLIHYWVKDVALWLSRSTKIK